jgi:hypothetical protein
MVSPISAALWKGGGRRLRNMPWAQFRTGGFSSAGIATGRDKQEHEKYADWCKRMGFETSASLRTYLQMTDGLGKGVIAWTGVS